MMLMRLLYLLMVVVVGVDCASTWYGLTYHPIVIEEETKAALWLFSRYGATPVLMTSFMFSMISGGALYLVSKLKLSFLFLPFKLWAYVLFLSVILIRGSAVLQNLHLFSYMKGWCPVSP